ncbi:MAG: GNAT family N-acetyltransferase [Nanoarchaeota archaeon]
MKTKELTKEDLALEGLLDTLRNLREPGELNHAEQESILERIASQDGHVFIAVDDGKIIGTTTLLIEQKYIRQGAMAGHIEDVATRKGYEGKGVASALLRRALTYAEEKGCYKVILDCSRDTAPFYSRLGFYEAEVQMRYDFP